jgi:hypothetical protein
MELESEAVDVVSEVLTAADLIRKTADDKGLTQRVDVPDAPVEIKTDPKAPHRILD